jgi:hypothetical protein
VVIQENQGAVKGLQTSTTPMSKKAKKEHGRPVSGPFLFDHVSFGVETEDDLWSKGFYAEEKKEGK